MKTSWHLVWLLLGLYLNTPLVAHKECETGHYGSHCQNICNCKGPCGIDGSCGDGCSVGWFGPQCRYEDLSLISVTDPPKDFALVADYEGICVNHTDNSGIHVVFSEPVLFVWMRLTLKRQVSPESLSKLQVQFRSVQQRDWERIPCTNKSLVMQSKAVNVVCHQVVNCTDIFLEWEDMRDMCSISISKECYPGLYGPGCDRRCSDLCLEGLCDFKDGLCFNCPSGHTGPSCENECEPTYYGINCQLRCSHNCLNQLCFRTSGHCVACPFGRAGYTCEQETLTELFSDFSNDSVQNKTSMLNTASTVGSTVALIVSPVIASIVLAVIVVLLYTKRDKVCRFCLGPRYPKYRVFTTSETDFSTDENDDTVIISQ